MTDKTPHEIDALVEEVLKLKEERHWRCIATEENVGDVGFHERRIGDIDFHLVVAAPKLARYVKELRERLSKLDGNDEHPENRCQRCGGRNLHNWYADSDVWNAHCSGFGILCPICFSELAESHGLRPTAWRLAPADDSDEKVRLMVRLHEAEQENAELREGVRDEKH